MLIFISLILCILLKLESRTGYTHVSSHTENNITSYIYIYIYINAFYHVFFVHWYEVYCIPENVGDLICLIDTDTNVTWKAEVMTGLMLRIALAMWPVLLKWSELFCNNHVSTWQFQRCFRLESGNSKMLGKGLLFVHIYTHRLLSLSQVVLKRPTF